MLRVKFETTDFETINWPYDSMGWYKSVHEYTVHLVGRPGMNYGISAETYRRLGEIPKYAPIYATSIGFVGTIDLTKPEAAHE